MKAALTLGKLFRDQAWNAPKVWCVWQMSVLPSVLEERDAVSRVEMWLFLSQSFLNNSIALTF